MDKSLIRVLIEVELSRVEFDLLAEYADATRRDIASAAADMMLTGLTLGVMEESTYENPEIFPPAAGSPLSMNWPEVSNPPGGGDATTTTTTDDDDDDECGGKSPPAPPSPEALRAG